MRMTLRNKVMGAGVITLIGLAGIACDAGMTGSDAETRAEKAERQAAEVMRDEGSTTTSLDLDSAYKAERKVWTRDSEVTGAEMVCIIVLPDADHGADAFDQLESIYGEIDYENGVWLDESSSTAIGYSSYEDSIVWNYPECTGPGQDYFDEQG